LASLVLILTAAIIGVWVSIQSSKWISFLIILLFLGGIIVLFVYICTLISSIKIIVIRSYKHYFSFLIFILLIGVLFITQKIYFLPDIKNLLLSTIYQKSRLALLVICMVYLLSVLLVCVKIVQKYKGGLKSKIMIFKFYYFLFIYLLFFNLIGGDFSSIYIIWYIIRFLLLAKLYSHVRFMLLALEVTSLISIALILFIIMKNGLPYRIFFLFLCLAVGEAIIGLRLLVFSSRIEAKELTSITIV